MGYLHKEGKTIVLGSTVLFVVLSLLFFKFLPLWAAITLFLPLTVFFILLVRFFRNPQRIADTQSNSVVSPCDGKVVVIEKVFETEYFKDERIQVSIFMSPLNVHVNRNPISGIFSYFKYHPGKYLVAWHPKSSTENERTTAVIKNNSGIEILFRQIAGAVARRICWYVDKGQAATKGEEMGFIKFGSRVDVFLPLDADIKVAINQKVSAAESVIATI
jgi:phosphatidylserine decarboxylase